MAFEGPAQARHGSTKRHVDEPKSETAFFSRAMITQGRCAQRGALVYRLRAKRSEEGLPQHKKSQDHMAKCPSLVRRQAAPRPGCRPYRESTQLARHDRPCHNFRATFWHSTHPTSMPTRAWFLTECAITLYRPIEASRIATKANPASSAAAARCAPSELSNTSRPVMTRSSGTPGAMVSHCRRMPASNSSGWPRVRTVDTQPLSAGFGR